MSEFPKKLQARLDTRRREGNLRALPAPSGRVDFTSNDYLGLARLPGPTPGASAAVAGRGSTGSRLLSGNHPMYEETERLVAAFHRAGAALIYNSGYDANLGLLSALLQRTDYVFYDRSVHASIRDGLSLGLARSYRYAHNDLQSLQQTVRNVLGKGRPPDAEVYVLTESVFSMEGDGPDLVSLAAYCAEKGFRLILDEAHAVGVLGPEGRGAAIGEGIHEGVFARVVTFGKALGCHGAAILGSPLLKEYLLNFSRSLIYTTALPPHSLEAIAQAYGFLESPEGAVAREELHQVLAYFAGQIGQTGLNSYFEPARAAIFSCRVPGNARARETAAHLEAAGFDVRPILSPTVPEGQECLRFCVHRYNTPSEIREVLTILAQKLQSETDG
jgi:8-amino-7-oxononanoate synthase